MTKSRGLLLLIVGAAAVATLLWFKQCGGRGGSVKQTSSLGSAAHLANPSRPEPVEPARAEITVSGPSGPIAGATVRVGKDGDVTLGATNAQGVARFDSLEAGHWEISASAAGHEPNAASSSELRAGETTKIDIKLVAGGRALTGTITDASGGPISGARIDAAKVGTMAHASNAVASTTTGADGKYTLTVAEGQLLVAASEASYAPQSRYVDVGAAGAKADFQLVPGGVIEGVVLDDKTREPVPGAFVVVERDGGGMAMFGERARHRATSGGNGRFRVAGLRPGAYSIRARAAKRISQTPTSVGIGVAEQVTDVEILVGGAASVRGIVVDENGAPAPGVSVNAWSDAGLGTEDELTANAKGEFLIDGLPQGRYKLMATNNGYVSEGVTSVDVGTADLEGIKVNVRHGLKGKGHVEPRQPCEVKLENVDRGAALPSIYFGSYDTAADGNFELGVTRAGTFTLSARCTSGDQGEMKVTMAPNMGEVVLPVKPGASIAGRVVDGKGQPVASATVTASPTDAGEHTMIVNGMFVSGVQAITNTKGEFELRGLHAGAYRMRVLDRGKPLPMKNDPKLTVAAVEKKTGVVLTVDRPDGVIKGIVTTADGKPLADAWVSIDQGIHDLVADADMEHGESRMVTVENSDDGSGAQDGGYAPVLTDADGKFTITGLPRVKWTVTAEAQAGKLRGSETFTPDATVTIKVFGLSELKGTVKTVGGTVPPWFTVALVGPTLEARTFATKDGSFSFSRVDPGKYHLNVTSSEGNGSAEVTVTAAQPASVTVTLAANAIVIGKLVDKDGKPLGGLPVAVVPDADDGQLRIELSGPPPTSNPDGTFRLEAKAGRSAVLVLTPPRPVSKKGLMLEAGKTFDAGTITVDASGPSPKP